MPQIAPTQEDEKDERLIINICSTIYDVVGNSARRFGFRECKEDPGLTHTTLPAINQEDHLHRAA
jgi:hypothetical protein